MKVTYQHAQYGQIDYEESAWTGKKELTVNGVKLAKKHKNIFVLNTPEEPITCTVKGSFISGSQLVIGQEVIQLTPAAKWYEIACSVLIFMLILIWGNSEVLCSIIPIIGGAIGGAISGAMGCLNLMLMKKSNNIGIKLCIWLGMLVGTFLICFLFALIFAFIYILLY